MLPWFELPDAVDVAWAKTSKQPIAVIGAGLAGLWVTRSLLKRGFAVTLYEAGVSFAAGASASPAAIVKPYVTREASDAERFYANAYQTLKNQLDELPAGTGFANIGALQLVEKAYPERLPVFTNLDATAATEKAGTTLASSALFFANAGCVSAHQLCACLFKDITARGVLFKSRHQLTNQQRKNRTWHLTFNKNTTQLHQSVILATGAALAQFPQLQHANVIPARGQLTQFVRSFNLQTVVSGKHYAIPDKRTVWLGATFQRGDAEPLCRDIDDATNRAAVKALLPAVSAHLGDKVNRFAGVRATTIDRFPIVGPVPDYQHAKQTYADIHHGRSLQTYAAPTMLDGLAVIGGLGSRGIVVAPYVAELLADWVNGGEELQSANRFLSPLRFLIRHLKRQKSH